MTTPNFSSILDEAPTEVKAPPVLPVGTYLCVVGQGRVDKSTNKGTEFTEFPLRPIQAGEDVDEDELNEIGGVDGKNLRVTFWHTPEAIYRLDQFHEHCGIDLSDPTSRKARNEMIVNAHVLAVVKHETSKDGTRIFANVARTAPAE